MISRVQNIQKLRDKLLVQRNTTTRHRSFFLRSFKSKKNTSKNWRRPFNFHFSFIRMRHFSIFIFLSKENSNLNLGLSNLLCACATCANWFVIQGRMRRMIELKRGQNKTQVELSCFSYQRQSRTRNTTHTKERRDWLKFAVSSEAQTFKALQIIFSLFSSTLFLSSSGSKCEVSRSLSSSLSAESSVSISV